MSNVLTRRPRFDDYSKTALVAVIRRQEDEYQRIIMAAKDQKESLEAQIKAFKEAPTLRRVWLALNRRLV